MVHGRQLDPLPEMAIAALAFPIGLYVARAPWTPLICQYPKSFVGLCAYCLPPDSAMAISAAMNACDLAPPAATHRASRPEQPRLPLSLLAEDVSTVVAGFLACLAE